VRRCISVLHAHRKVAGCCALVGAGPLEAHICSKAQQVRSQQNARLGACTVAQLLRDPLSVTCQWGCARAQSLANGGVVFVDAGRGGASRVSATAALKHRFMAQVRSCVPAHPNFVIGSGGDCEQQAPARCRAGRRFIHVLPCPTGAPAS